MKFSILIPSYNKTKYVKDAIKSVLNQTYSDWELLIAENSSDPRCRKAVHKLAEKDERIKVFDRDFTKEERIAECPLGKLVTEGWNMSQGDYLAFHADDDTWNPETLAKFAEYFTANPDHLCAYMGWKYIWLTQKGDKIFDRKVELQQVFDKRNNPLNVLDGGSTFVHKTVLQQLSRPYYPALGLHNPQTRISDGLFLRNVALVSPIYPIGFSGLTHRRTPLSTFDHFDNTRKEQILGGSAQLI